MRTISHHARRSLVVLWVAVSCLAACDGATDPEDLETGLVRVTLVTTGVDPDATGYAVRVDDQRREAGINEILKFPDVPRGERSVRLEGVAPNCSPEAFTQTIRVTPETTSDVTFDVQCAARGTVVFWRWLGTHRDVFVMETDGSGLRNLTNDAASDLAPAWSPDGSRIVAVGGAGGETSLYVMDADGSNRRQLTSGAHADNFPAWSPDESKIAFSRGAQSPDIYVINADGSGLVNLTRSPGTWDTEPEWSPDGTRLVFGRDGDLYVMNADGSQPALLEENGSGPVWSPTGTRIAFTSSRGGNLDVYVMNADASAVTRLTSHPGDDIHPAWSPDESRIAYTSFRAGVGSIYLMKPDGTGHTVLADGAAGGSHQAHWRP